VESDQTLGPAFNDSLNAEAKQCESDVIAAEAPGGDGYLTRECNLYVKGLVRGWNFEEQRRLQQQGSH
jgi:hypothetical protein